MVARAMKTEPESQEEGKAVCLLWVADWKNLKIQRACRMKCSMDLPFKNLLLPDVM